tara:strand:+ start:269 stop:442 length:174 start_codon:yes stop_codon:yes gene_type:complete
VKVVEVQTMEVKHTVLVVEKVVLLVKLQMLVVVLNMLVVLVVEKVLESEELQDILYT